MAAAALLALAVLATAALHIAGQADSCNITCQSDQRQALQSFYTSLSGPTWLNNTGWTLASADSTSSDWPGHCSWVGVACCSSAGAVDFRFSAFAVPVPINCSSAASVAGLYLVNQGLAGSLPHGQDVWGPLASIVYLSLSGESLLAAVPLRSWPTTTMTPTSTALIPVLSLLACSCWLEI